MRILVLLFFLTGINWLGADDAMRMAAQRAIPLIEKSAAIYTEQRDCFSCHHQALTVMALSRAKLADLPVRDDAISEQSKFTLEYFSDRKDRLPKGCLLYTSPSPRDRTRSRMPSSA